VRVLLDPLAEAFPQSLTSTFMPSRIIAACRASSAARTVAFPEPSLGERVLMVFMPAILQQIYATEKNNYFNAPPVFQMF
jgi:hypothetical protein